MLGLCGLYTPISADVGATRTLVANPKITNTRGNISKDFDVPSSTQENLFTYGELLNVFTPNHADSSRVAMASVQSGHIIPTKVQHSYLVGNGTDKALAHVIGQDYSFKSQESGIVTKIDTKNNLVFLKYSNGVQSAIDIRPRMAKNEGGGFYSESRLTLNPGIRVGSKFKQGDILAYDEKFFKKGETENNFNFAAGKLTYVAVSPMSETFEDSCIVTERFKQDMSTEIVTERDLTFKKNTRIISIAKLGDKVSTNDPLVIFEEVSDDEKEALATLDRIDKKNSKQIQELARNIAKAKYAGEIVDIKILYNVELDELHSSLRKVVNEYLDINRSKAKLLSNIQKDQIIELPSTEKIDNTKIYGTEMEGVMILFYIKHLDECKVGDKVTFFTSAKCIIAQVVPEGQEPHSEYRNEIIDSVISPMSLISRMIPDLYLLGYTNKVLMELKRQCIDDLEL